VKRALDFMFKLATVAFLVFGDDDTPAHDPFVALGMVPGDRVVALEHRAVGRVIHRHVDYEGIEDIYVINTDDGLTLVVPESGLRLALA